MYQYEVRRHVLQNPYILGIPFNYGIKLGVSLLVGVFVCLIAGLKLLIVVLPIIGGLYFYFMYKFKKYGELEVEIRTFNNRAKGIYIDDTMAIEKLCYKEKSKR